jgi:hypothetical protein
MKTRVQEYIDSVEDDIEVFDDLSDRLIATVKDYLTVQTETEEDYDALVCKVFVFGRR